MIISPGDKVRYVGRKFRVEFADITKGNANPVGVALSKIDGGFVVEFLGRAYLMPARALYKVQA